MAHVIRAFTLIEVLITLVILSIAVTALYRGNIMNLRAEKEAADLTIAVSAAELLMKEAVTQGYSESGIVKGKFEDGVYAGMEWEKAVESFNIPLALDLQKVQIDVFYGRNKRYTLTTVVSRY